MTDGQYFAEFFKSLGVVYCLLGAATLIGLGFWGAIFYAATKFVQAVAGTG